MVHPANVQDRDGALPLLRAARGALPLLRAARRQFPGVERIFAAAGSQGAATAAAVRALGAWHLEIVKPTQAGVFEPLPKRWIVERTFAWMGRCRRLAKDLETLTRTALASLHLAMIRLMLRRLARASADA